MNGKPYPQRASALKELIRQRWPEAVKPLSQPPGFKISTGIPELDRLFPKKGLSFGCSLAIVGGRSSGKTSLVFRLGSKLIPRITKTKKKLFVDWTGTFFPPSAALAGIDLRELLVAKPPNLPLALRTAEILSAISEIGLITVNAGNWTGPFPDRLIRRLHSATSARNLPVIFVFEQKRPSDEVKRAFPFVISIRRALVMPELEQPNTAKSRYFRIRVEGNKQGAIGTEVVVNLYENQPDTLCDPSTVSAGHPLSAGTKA